MSDSVQIPDPTAPQVTAKPIDVGIDALTTPDQVIKDVNAQIGETATDIKTVPDFGVGPVEVKPDQEGLTSEKMAGVNAAVDVIMKDAAEKIRATYQDALSKPAKPVTIQSTPSVSVPTPPADPSKNNPIT